MIPRFSSLIFLLSISFYFSHAQNGLTFHPYPPNYTLTQLRSINDVKVDAQLNVWVAFRYIGLGKYNGSGWTFYDTINSNIPSKNVLSISIDNQNNIWAGTEKGLAKFDGVTWTIFDSINSDLPGSVVFAVKNSGNNVWCGTNFGLSKFDGSNWTTFNNQNSGITGDSVRCIELALNGEIWIGTLNMGISKFYNSTWQNFNSSNSVLPNGLISKIVVDGNNDAWTNTTNSNLFKITGLTLFNYYKDLYTGFVNSFLNLIPIVKNNSGNILIPSIDITFTHLTFNEIKGNDIEITSCKSEILFASGGSLFSKSAFDTNGIVWIATVAMDTNANYGMISWDKNQNIPVPFMVTNINSKLLDINGVKAAILNRGDMHWDLSSARYEVPKGSGKNSVFTSAIWMGGIDNGMQLHAAAQTYRQTGNDYWPGPIDTVTGISDSATALLYDKIWKVNRNTIEDFKINFANGSVGNGTYPVPDEITSWPAQGTGNITRDLAPFVDYNSDGLYNPLNGDYPLIKGDQMLYWIFNDNLAQHTVTNSPSLNVELHCSAYSVFCDQLPDSEAVMHHTTLYEYRIINRSLVDYNDYVIGLWSDMDVGNPSDDFIGCDTVLNAGFTYNADNDDDGINGYGLNPPLQNIKILKGPFADAGDGIDNDHDGTIDEPGEECLMSGFMTYENSSSLLNGNPISGMEYFNYLNSRWRDGTPLTYGGSGYNPTGAIPTKFIYNGTPYDTSALSWNGGSLSGPPNDSRLLLSCGPFTLPAGGETTIDFAYVFSHDSIAANGINTSVAKNKMDLKKVQNWFDNNNFPSCLPPIQNVGQSKNNSLSFIIIPNPSTDIINIEGENLDNDSYFEILDFTGSAINSGKLKQGPINIKNLSNGIYLFFIKNGSQTAKRKFIKI